MTESKFAPLLRRLGFEPWEPPYPEYFPEPGEVVIDPPVFVFGWHGETMVYDETGQHWIKEGQIDLKPYGLDCLMEKCREEQGKVTKPN